MYPRKGRLRKGRICPAGSNLASLRQGLRAAVRQENLESDSLGERLERNGWKLVWLARKTSACCVSPSIPSCRFADIEGQV